MKNYNYPLFWSHRSLKSFLLLPLSLIFSLLTWCRKKLIKPLKITPKVICVGNITVGGTGKTQVIIALSDFLKSQNASFVIVTKAYNSQIKTGKLVQPHDNPLYVGDESKLLSQYGPVLACPCPHSAQRFIQSMKPDFVLLDDGMQSPYWKRNINICVFDSKRLLGNGYILPAGPLRESLTSGLDKAHACLIIDSHKLTSSNTSDLESKKTSQQLALEQSIKKKNIPIFYAHIEPTNIPDKNLRYLAFTGIGDPNRFFQTLKSLDLQIALTKTYPDHHQYTQDDRDNLEQLAQNSNLTLITTCKDSVKLENMNNLQTVQVQLSMSCPESWKNFCQKIFS